MSKTYIGIEIGNYTLKLALCSNNEIKDLAVEVLPNELVKDSKITSYEAVADFLKETMKKYHISCKNACIVIPDNLTYIKDITMPAMTVNQLKVNLPYEFHDYITEDKEDYIYDYAVEEIKKDDSGTPTEMKLLGVAVKKSVMEQYRDMLKRAGMKLAKAAPIALAYHNLLKSNEQKDYAVLDLGHLANKMFLYRDHNYEITRNMEPGMISLTNAIMESTGVDKHIAEIYKQQNTDGCLEKEESNAIYNAMSVELTRVINFFNYNNPDNTLSTIYYCGGGASVKPLIDTLSSSIDKKLVSMSEVIQDSDFDDNSINACACAVGICRGDE